MAIAKIQSPVDNTQKLLSSFAHAQLSPINPKSIKQNSFQLFAITAFLYGAISRLGKQSTLSEHLIQEYLNTILCDEFGLPRHNIEGLISSINRMMENYYLLENIFHEGEASAEVWLTNDDADCLELKTLLDNYREFTLMDMKAAGMKSDSPSFAQVQQNAQATNKSVWPLVITGTVGLGIVLTVLYYTLIV